MTKRLISFLIALCLLIAIPLSARYKYNPFTRKLDYYEPVSGSDLGDLGDVTLTGLATGNVLYYNGTAWVNLATGANTNVLTLAAGIPSWAAPGAPAAHAASHEVGGGDLVDHDQLTNWVANKHINWTAAADNFSTSEDFTLAWTEAADHVSITQTAVAGVATVPLINIDDDRTGVTADTVGEATIVMNAAGTYAFYIQTGQAYFAADTTQVEDVFIEWADAADHMVIHQGSESGIENQPLIFIDDDRTGAFANAVGEATIVMNAAGTYAFYVQTGEVYFDQRATFTDEVSMAWAEASDYLNIYQASATQTEDVALVAITSEAEGATVDEPSEALLVLNTEQAISWALYAQSGIVEYADNVYWNWAGATDRAIITQTAVAGTEGQPLIFIDDARTGATASSKEEATIRIDAEGSHALYIEDGYVYFAAAAVFESASDVITTNKFWAKDNAWIAWGTAIDWQTNWDENAGGDDLLVHVFMGSGTTALWYSLLNPSGMTDHNSYLSPTFVLTNDEGADTNDYSGVVIGERAQANVKIAHYFDFYAMTGASDGSVDVGDELAAIFRFGASGSATPDFATTPGDVLFEGSVEVDGALWVADNPIRENLLSNSGFGVWSQSDTNKGIATITYDAGSAGGGSAPSVGDAAVGGTSGAVAKVISYTIGSGAFATNDATGVVTVGAVSSDFAFVNNETITFGGVETASINMSDGAVQVGKLRNGGFATDTDPPPGWDAINSTLTTEAGGEVGNCLQIDRTGGAWQSADQQMAGLVVGKIYKASAYVKSGTSGDEDFRLGIVTADKVASIAKKDGVSSGAWVLYSVSFEATETNHWLVVYKQTATAGTMLFDEVTSYEITPGATAADILACDMWEKNTVGHIYREHDGTNTKDGSFYSAKMVPNAGGFYLLFPKTYYSNEYHLKHFAGRTVTFGVWVKTLAASHAYLRAYDGVTTTNGDYHTGGGAFEWLEITKVIASAASNVHFQVRTDLAGNVDGTTIVYVNQPMLVYGSAIGEGNYQKKSQEFIWLEKKIQSNAYDGLLAQSDLAYTDLNLEADSDAMLPKGIRVIAIHTEIDDSASGGGTDVHLELRKNATAGTFYCNSVAGKPNNVHSHQMGLQPCDVNGDIDIHLDASGGSTLDIDELEYHGVQIN
ncbi:hypothetical protein LCGC14_0489340 [marine sediment metagenome]|uniref:Uncharacterized protein n=1 Tax=marine sediment metagenome TaxID=412755 RepID=A0A0F9S710_9ZZZZ|nr:hypothetical protein [Candidatus Aminicenantes bacterium]